MTIYIKIITENFGIFHPERHTNIEISTLIKKRLHLYPGFYLLINIYNRPYFSIILKLGNNYKG